MAVSTWLYAQMAHWHENSLTLRGVVEAQAKEKKELVLHSSFPHLLYISLIIESSVSGVSLGSSVG